MSLHYITFALFMAVVNLVLIWLFQRKLVYNPQGNLFGVVSRQTPLDLQMTYKDVQLTATDGISLQGWLITQPGAGPCPTTFVFLGGSHGPVSLQLPAIK